jgi:large subunit ribosomal protein L5
MNNLQKQYNEKICPILTEKLGRKKMALPKLEKIVLNIGLGQGLKDKEYLETVKSTLIRITGQKPVETVARKSISNFKIREGMVIGAKVTLRGRRMWDFLEKLIKISLPRVRDFRGISENGFDARGNYTLGFKENLAFPEIKQEEIERIHGLELTIVNTANNKEEARLLLGELGLPFANNLK